MDVIQHGEEAYATGEGAILLLPDDHGKSGAESRIRVRSGRTGASRRVRRRQVRPRRIELRRRASSSWSPWRRSRSSRRSRYSRSRRCSSAWASSRRPNSISSLRTSQRAVVAHQLGFGGSECHLDRRGDPEAAVARLDDRRLGEATVAGLGGGAGGGPRQPPARTRLGALAGQRQRRRDRRLDARRVGVVGRRRALADERSPLLEEGDAVALEEDRAQARPWSAASRPGGRRRGSGGEPARRARSAPAYFRAPSRRRCRRRPPGGSARPTSPSRVPPRGQPASPPHSACRPGWGRWRPRPRGRSPR